VKEVVDQEHNKAKNFTVFCKDDEVYDFKMNEEDDELVKIIQILVPDKDKGKLRFLGARVNSFIEKFYVYMRDRLGPSVRKYLNDG